MSNISQKIIFFGNERLVSGLASTNAPVLRGLIERGYNVVAIVSHHSQTRSRKARPLEVADIATQHDIPLFLPNKPSDIIDELREFNADIAVLSAYGRIIPASVIDIFPHGIINVHPSLLPRWRGPTPIESTILHGDKTAGVSIMQLAPEMDAGPVYIQAETPLRGDEDKFELYETLSTLGATLLLDNLTAIHNGSLLPKPQNDIAATYCPLLDKNDGWLQPHKHTASEAERHVRAYLSYPKTKLQFDTMTLIITKAHVASEKNSPLDVVCRGGEFLVIDELIAPSGRRMNSSDFLRGYQKT